MLPFIDPCKTTAEVLKTKIGITISKISHTTLSGRRMTLHI